MAGNTTNYGIARPVVGGDESVWGNTLNTGLDTIDGVMKANEDAVTAAAATANSADSKVNQLLASLYDRIYPVGSIFLAFTNVSPQTLFPGTTWVRFAQGAALVGVGGGPNSVQLSVGATTGSKEVQLGINHMPAHTHGPGSLRGVTGQSGALRQTQVVQHSVAGGGNFIVTGVIYDNGATHTHSVVVNAGATNQTGGNSAHTNVQPSIGVNVWRRTQ